MLRQVPPSNKQRLQIAPAKQADIEVGSVSLRRSPRARVGRNLPVTLFLLLLIPVAIAGSLFIRYKTRGPRIVAHPSTAAGLHVAGKKLNKGLLVPRQNDVMSAKIQERDVMTTSRMEDYRTTDSKAATLANSGDAEVGYLSTESTVKGAVDTASSKVLLRSVANQSKTPHRNSTSG